MIVQSHILDEVKQILDDISKFKKETDNFNRSAENHLQQILLAEQQIVKGKEQKEALERKHKYLRESVEEDKEKIEAAKQFWDSMGFSIKPVSHAHQTTTIDFGVYPAGKHKPIPKHFEFEYKINERVYVIEVKLHNNHVRIPSHSPALLTSADILNMELKLSKECTRTVNSTKGDEVTVDWRRVIVTLWRTLINKG